MNIFLLSLDPRRAAEWHCDKHVVKMLLESTQLLWTAWHYGGGDRALLETAPCCRSTGAPGYRPTHRNHPCAVWVRASITNYRWLIALARALAEEWRWRWGREEALHACVRSRQVCERREHACEPHIAWLAANEPPLLPRLPLTNPALAMPDEYKISLRATDCYRAYYCGQKAERGLLVYTRREMPSWASLRIESVDT